MKISRIAALILAVCFIAGMIPVTASAEASASIRIADNGSLPVISGAQKGVVWFGSYTQTSDGNGGFNVDPIKWRVLSNSNGKLFLLADQNLDSATYHNADKDITWENCYLRAWLRDTFLKKAFSAAEQNAISLTEVVNKNSSYGAPGGNSTKDKVFLLSSDEVTDTAYGFSSDPDKTGNESGRIATNTAYTASHSGLSGEGKSNRYWLRSPGIDSFSAAAIQAEGNVGVSDYVMSEGIAIRPAFNVDLKSVLFASPAVGGKSSDGVGASALKKVGDYTGSEWKLTIIDSSRKFTVTEKEVSAARGETVELNYKGATVNSKKAGAEEYVSVILADSKGNALYYGNLLKTASADGKVQVTLPSELANGNYILKLFSEQLNGDKSTDYASAFSDVKLTVEDPKFTVTFKNWDNTVLQSEDVVSGSNPEYTGETPSRDNSAQYTYTFSGWNDGTKTYGTDDTLPAVTGEATYTAVFSETVNEYAVRFVDEDGKTELQSGDVAYGKTPSYTGKTPSKVNNAQYTYTFSCWNDGTNTYGKDDALPSVTGEATYTAVFSETVNEYTVTFVDEDGKTELQKGDLAYGKTPSYTGETPTKESSAQYTYTFSGWNDGKKTYASDAKLPSVKGNAKYTAVYSEQQRLGSIVINASVDNYEGESVTFTFNLVDEESGGENYRHNAVVQYSAEGWQTTTVNGIPAGMNIICTAVASGSKHTIKDDSSKTVTVVADSEVNVYFTFTKTAFNVSFVNEGEETPLQTEELSAGQIPSYNGKTPEKQPDDDYTYAFSGWDDGKTKYGRDDALPAVTKSVTYTATYEKKPKPVVNVMKTDIDTGEAVEGAKLQILDNEGNVIKYWTSTTEAQVVKGLEPGVEYTLREEAAPDGYTIATDTTFTIDEDGKITATGSVTTDENGAAVLLVENAKTVVRVLKTDNEDKPLAGASLQILDSEGNVIEEWKSTAEARVIEGLKTGEEYTLHEKEPPQHYTAAEDITFTIDNNGKITSTGDVATDSEGNAVFVLTSEPSVEYDVTLTADSEAGGTVSGDGTFEENTSVTVSAKANDDYKFDGWYSGDEKVSEDAEYTFTLTQDTDLTARFTKKTVYTVIWLNGNGTKLDTKTYQEGDPEPTTQKVPKKDENEYYTYTFKSWDKGTVKGTTKTYKPIFTSKLKTQYYIIWLNYDGTVFAKKSYMEGAGEITLDKIPEKPDDADNTYTFTLWKKVKVSGTTTTYQAVFTAVPKPVYTVVWLNGDGSVLESKTYKSGNEPKTNRVPVKAEDSNYTYVFSKWDKGTVNGKTKTYSPLFTAIAKEKSVYTIKWIDDSGKVIGTATFTEDQDPPKLEIIPAKAEDEKNTYVFEKWEIYSVNGNETTFRAVFKAIAKPAPEPVQKKQYTVIWMNDNGTKIDSATYEEGQPEPLTARIPEKTEEAAFTYIFVSWYEYSFSGTVKTYKPLYLPVQKPIENPKTSDEGPSDVLSRFIYGLLSKPLISK